MFSIKNLLLMLLLATAVFSFQSCGEDAKANDNVPESIVETPKLLDRPAAIQAGAEWTNVQNHYGTNRQKLVQDPNAVEPRLNLALLFMQEARVTGEHGHYYPAALKMLNEALAQKNEDPDLLFRTLTAKASVMLSQHEFSQALEIGKRALTMNQYNSGIYGVMVDANVEMGNYEEAVKMSDKMVSVRPDLRSYSRVSYLREIHGQVDGAIEAMKMAVSAGFPGYEETAWTRLTLGDLYRTYGDDKNAEMQYRMILAEREDYPFAIAALGDLEMERGNYEEAEKLLKQAANIIPEFGFYVSLVDLYQKTGREKEAKETLDEVFVMLQDDIDSGHNMNLEYADLYLNQAKDLDKALKYALDEYAKRPANISVNKMLAKIYAERGEQEKAAMHIEKASITNSKDPELLALKN